MPAAKKTATKKAPTKKTAPKRAPAKNAHATTVRRVATPSTPAVRSFRRAERTEPFLTFRITRQTLYWCILACLVLALGIWVTTISIKVQRIYDQIDEANRQIDLLDMKPSTKKTQ